MRDRDVRVALLDYLYTRHSADGSRIVEEMGLLQGDTRIDIAVINGELTGYEIKSPRDTLVRLPYQQALYSRVLDRACLVTSDEQLDAARPSVPGWWGLLTIACSHDRVQILIRRKPKLNPNPEPFAIAQLLWRDEALRLLHERGAARDIKGRGRVHLWTRLTETYSLPDLQDAVRNVLKARSHWLTAPSRT